MIVVVYYFDFHLKKLVIIVVCFYVRRWVDQSNLYSACVDQLVHPDARNKALQFSETWATSHRDTNALRIKIIISFIKPVPHEKTYACISNTAYIYSVSCIGGSIRSMKPFYSTCDPSNHRRGILWGILLRLIIQLSCFRFTRKRAVKNRSWWIGESNKFVF